MLDADAVQFDLQHRVERTSAPGQYVGPGQARGFFLQPLHQPVNVPYHPRRGAGDDGSRRHVAVDHGAGGDDGVGTDGDARQQNRAVADEDIIADVNFPHPVQLQPVGAVEHVHRAVVAEQGAAGQSDVVAQPGVGRVGDDDVGLNRTVLADSVQHSPALEPGRPFIPAGVAEPLVPPDRLAPLERQIAQDAPQ